MNKDLQSTSNSCEFSSQQGGNGDRRLLRKVCGMRSATNIQAVEALGIDWMGFICWPKSSRYVDETPAYLPKCERVGVFVNADFDFIEQKFKQLGLTRIQLHGDEMGDFCKEVTSRLGVPVVKAISVNGVDDVKKAEQYHGIVSHILFDTKCKCVGGSGEQFDWEVLRSYNGPTPFLLAGGIGPDDAQRIKQFQHPYFAGIDLNSRFEDAPALKNVDKLAIIVKNA